MARAVKPAGATDRHRRSAIVVAARAALVAVVLLGGGLGVWLATEGGMPWDVAREPPQAWLKLPPPPSEQPAATDRRDAWQLHGRPFDGQDPRPRIAIVVTGLGLSATATEAVMRQLPGAVTLAFAPYAKRLDEWIGQARAAGHEVLLDLPMEPRDYPRDDPGPFTLLTSLSPEQNLARLDRVLSGGTGYVGVNNMMGSRFAATSRSLRPIFENLKLRGLMFLDGRTEQRAVAAQLAVDLALPYAVNNVQIDAEASRLAIDAALRELERQARNTGFAVGMASPYPVTLERLAHWVTTLQRKKLALAPVTAVVDKQPLP
jgi:hypothetical protein